MKIIERLENFQRKGLHEKAAAIIATLYRPFRPLNLIEQMAKARRRNNQPGQEPWRRETLDIVRAAGLGDVLMCTPGLREAKRINPSLRIRFYTEFPSLITGLPYIDEVHPPLAAPKSAIHLGYEDLIPPSGHLASVIANMIALPVLDVMPDCIIRHDLVAKYKNLWSGGPNIVVSRHASKWTPNKDWPLERWDALLHRLSLQYRVIEIGMTPETQTESSHGRYVDLRGKTDIDTMVAVIASADAFVGPVSGPTHIAAAARIPVVSIVGGYESEENTRYSVSRSLISTMSCSPCWLRTPCPYNLACLTTILVEQVESEIKLILNK